MMKKNYVFLILILLLISACSDIDLVLPKGDKGDPGEKGLSAYQDWVSMVDNGVYPDWVGYTDKTDFMKFLSGSNGASAYDLWKDMISSGKVPHPHKPGEFWDSSKNSQEDFFEYLTGQKGDPGIPGSNVTINDKGNWAIDGVDTGVPARGKDGTDGASAYEIWVNKVKLGEMPDKDNPAKPWDITKISLEDFWEYFSGKPGKDGLTPKIGDNGNWWIGTTDTGVPARGLDGTDGSTPEIGGDGNWVIGGINTGKPSQGKGIPGDSAYDLWKKEVAKGKLKNPHPDAIGYEGEFWNISKISLYDFWFYLRGRDGKDGQDGEDGKTEIIKGKPNVIVEYYNSKTKEYIDPKDGSATFTVYDKEGIKVSAGVVVKGLPAIDPNVSFTTDENGAIYVERKYLPNKKTIQERMGVTSFVTIRGETLASASNTLVPNRVNTRLTLKDVYLRPNSPWDWSRSTSINDFTVIRYIYEREIDGVWVLTETYKHQNKLAVVHIRDINKPISKQNIEENIDDVIAHPESFQKWGSARGEGGSSGNPTTPFFDLNDGIFLIYRPIVLTTDEKNFDIHDGTRYPDDSRMDWILQQLETSRKYAWDGIDRYITVIGYENYYGEYPILDAKIHNPEIYPSPSIVDVKYQMNGGASVLTGKFDERSFAPVYLEYTEEDNIWRATKYDKLGPGDGPGFQISMTKFTDVESGSTELKVKSSLEDLSFSLGSAYPNNVVTTRVFSYWHLPEVGRFGDCNSFYRLRPVFDFYNKGTNQNPQYVLKDIYGSNEYNVPLINQ